ncbi:hypothetical protein K474DRAFT_1776244, partial [Panus rudis PR-1116 ss-1]
MPTVGPIYSLDTSTPTTSSTPIARESSNPVTPRRLVSTHLGQTQQGSSSSRKRRTEETHELENVSHPQAKRRAVTPTTESSRSSYESNSISGAASSDI